jgi:hypothetical protein
LFGGGDTNLYGSVLNDPINFKDPTGLRLAVGDPESMQQENQRETDTFNRYFLRDPDKAARDSIEEALKDVSLTQKGPAEVADNGDKGLIRTFKDKDKVPCPNSNASSPASGGGSNSSSGGPSPGNNGAGGDANSGPPIIINNPTGPIIINGTTGPITINNATGPITIGGGGH